jgi:succinoglycan biosynthesis transport protein ExoP
VEKPQTDVLDQQAIFRGIVRRHKRLVVGVFLVLALPLLWVIYVTSQPLFVSNATIAIEPSPLEQIPFFKDIPQKDSIATNLSLLNSRSLGEAVINALPRESFDELLSHPQYTDYLLTLSNRINRWMGKPPTVLSPQQQALAEIQMGRMEFTNSPQAPGIITIKATASNPRVAMDLANTYIQMLLGRTRSINQDEARTARDFLAQQVQQARENLNKAEEALTKFQQQTGQIRLGTQTELDLVKLSQTENALAEAQASREVTAARIAGLRQALEQRKAKETPGAAQGTAAGRDEAAAARRADVLLRVDAFKAAQENLAKLEAKLATIRQRYTEAYPLVQTTQEEVTKEQARVAQLARDLPAVPSAPESRTPGPTAANLSEPSELQRQLAGLETEESSLQAKVESLKLQVERLRKILRNANQEELGWSNLRRNIEANRNLVTVLSDKLMAAQIREQGEPAIVRIIDPASFPLKPSQSKTYRFVLMALALAGFLAFGSAYGLEYLRQPVETDADVQRTTGLTVLGYVGAIGKPTSRLPLYLPGSAKDSGIHMELYRGIRASIEAERLKSPFRSILVTSPAPNEGKSTTVLNLAHVFQEFGRRVLVVEADLRRPTIHRTLSLTSKPGLVDFLEGRAALGEVCRSLPSGVTVIPGQLVRGDTASMLASSRAKELLDVASAQFDMILVDSPPLLAVSDNLLLVTLLDRVILVAKASVTSKRDLRKAQLALQRTNAQILGVVLNQADARDVQYYQPRYRKYYKLGEAKPAQEAPEQRGVASSGKKS